MVDEAVDNLQYGDECTGQVWSLGTARVGPVGWSVPRAVVDDIRWFCYVYILRHVYIYCLSRYLSIKGIRFLSSKVPKCCNSLWLWSLGATSHPTLPLASAPLSNLPSYLGVTTLPHVALLMLL